MRIGLATAALLALATAAAAEPLRQLRGTVPRALAAMTPAGRAPADLRLGHVTVLLGLRHRRTLDALVAAQQDRRSPLFHRWLAAAYGVAPLQAAGLTGAGHSIAVVARSNFADTDVALFSSNFLSFQLAPVRVFPGADPGILAEEGERIEVLLDTQWAGSLASGATLDVVIGSPHGDIPEALIAAIENRAGDVVSLSFGLCEQAAPMVTAELFDAFYAVANSQGQTVRSEERRVGKECRSRWSTKHDNKKEWS